MGRIGYDGIHHSCKRRSSSTTSTHADWSCTNGQHLIIDAVRAFIGLTGGTDAHAYFHSVTNTTFLTKTVLWMGQTLLGDGILVRPAIITLEHAVLTGSCTWRSGDATSFTADG